MISTTMFAAQTRVIYFNKTSKGASFRLRCVSSDDGNRCSNSVFSTRAKELCEEANLTPGGVTPLSCIEEVDSGDAKCKLASGTCTNPPTDAVVLDRAPIEEENPAPAPVQSVDQLPEVGDLPQVDSLKPVRSLPDAGTLPQTGTLPEIQSLPESKSLDQNSVESFEQN